MNNEENADKIVAGLCSAFIAVIISLLLHFIIRDLLAVTLVAAVVFVLSYSLMRGSLND